MSAYYNEIDPQKAQWIRELVKAGVIAQGYVDERDIREIEVCDLFGYTQHHFFAGIGAWSYALRLAGWPDSRPCWTGSCPCPSFSAAGKGNGFADSRHLWPDWYRLICQYCPPVIFGEQVEAAIGHGWLDLVQTDLEAVDYAVGSAILTAAGVGAPHIRARLYFVAHAADSGYQRRGTGEAGTHLEAPQRVCSEFQSERHGDVGRPSNASIYGSTAGIPEPSSGQERLSAIAQYASDRGSTRGFWRDCDWWYGRDGKWRPIEPGLQPLASGVAARVLRLRGYGDAICAETAKAFIQAAQGAINDCHRS